jgi:two-component system response regulator QseB
MNDVALAFEPLALDPTSQTVSYQGRDISLTPREFAILQALLEHPGSPVSRMELRLRLYGGNEPGILGNPVQVHIHHLRAKLGEDVIRTVRGAGYVVRKVTCLTPPPSVISTTAAESDLKP